MNKKLNLVIILVILAVPALMYHFAKAPSENNASIAIAGINKPVLLQFSSLMCHDCKKLEKEIQPLKIKYQDKVVFRKINVSNRTAEVNQLIKKYNVNVVPTLVFIDKNGTTIKITEGYLPKIKLETYLDRMING